MPCCLPFYANWTESNISACMKETRIDKYSTSRESRRKRILFWPFVKFRSFSETPKLQIGSYECGSPIGQGSFSKVIKAVHLESHRKVAIKIIDLRKISEKDGTPSSDLASLKYLNLVKELQLQLQVRHENIVELIEVIQQDRYQFAVMPFAQNGNLLDWLEKKRGGRLGESEACFYFKQLISALAACHSVGVYHRDVKLENLLLMDEEALTLKLTDFGLGTSSYLNRHGSLNSCARISTSSFKASDASDKISSKLSTTVSLTHMDTLNYSEFSYEHFSCKTCCGTPLYASPEVLQGKSYSGGPADIWSAGVVLYMLVMGVAPFTSQSLEKLYDLIKKGLYTPTLGKVSRGILFTFEFIYSFY